MELGDSGIVSEADGWMTDKYGNRRRPDGVVFNKEGQVIWDPAIDEAYSADEEDE